MTPSELRKACELAGLEVRDLAAQDRPGEWGIPIKEPRHFWVMFPEHRVWIESRCASVLVGMVRSDGGITDMKDDMVGHWEKATHWEMDNATLGATDEQLIRAAFFALTGKELTDE